MQLWLVMALLASSGWNTGAMGQTINVKTEDDKVSPALREQTAALVLEGDPEPKLRFLVEFHSGMADGDMRAVVGGEGMLIREHPDLVSGHLMAEGTAIQVERLAMREETSYIWPASADLEKGLPVTACGGALLEDGPVGQYVARVGHGWDGPGKGAVELLWTLSRQSTRIPRDVLLSEVERALRAWSRVVRVDFRQGGTPNSLHHLNLVFAAGPHGDAFPFDGRGRTLAHTFYPAPVNAEPIAGDMHFDDDENWQVGTDTDVFSVALHELGHALGLGHADSPNAVMYPYYRRWQQLSEEDTQAARELYASREEAPQPGGGLPAAGNPTPSPNAPTPSAPPPAGTPDKVAPSVTVSSPVQNAVVVTTDTITLKGTARDNVGVALVTWWSNTAGTGLATGTGTWMIDKLPIMKGTNYFRVTVYDSSGNSSWKSVVVTRR